MSAGSSSAAPVRMANSASPESIGINVKGETEKTDVGEFEVWEQDAEEVVEVSEKPVITETPKPEEPEKEETDEDEDEDELDDDMKAEIRKKIPGMSFGGSSLGF